MKRIISSFLVAVLLAASLSGCSNPEKKTYKILKESSFPYYSLVGEEYWYGTTTDDERVAMADDILIIFQDLGYSTETWTGNTFAQEMNNYYDIDKIESIWTVACEVFGIDAQTYEDIYIQYA